MKAKVIETGEVVEVKCTRTAMYSTVDMSGEGNTEKFEETELEFIGEDSYRNDITLAIVIDSCEYLKSDSSFAGNHGFGFFAHKGNCRFCKERRQKELEKLITELKGK